MNPPAMIVAAAMKSAVSNRDISQLPRIDSTSLAHSIYISVALKALANSKDSRCLLD